LGIYKDKKTGKWKVKSYVTGKYHKRLYPTKANAKKAAGIKARQAYYKKKYVTGASYIYVVLIIVLATLTILFSVLSTIVNWSFDVMISNPVFNLDRRYSTLENMLRLWNAIPVAILLTIVLYGVLRQMRERQRF
jgi:hypothetical protein